MAARNPTGVLPVDKPAGPTSHDVVDVARRCLGIRRIGHTGTLDPFASGLLLLCIGSATRIAEYLTGLSKTYRAVIRLGESTDTDDLTGQVVERSASWRTLEPDFIGATLEGFLGEIEQRPPAFSAKKIGGVRMHRLARAGGAPAPAPVRVRIDALRIIAIDPPDVTLELDCSAGTYVRAVARDAGEALGCFAHLAELRRTRIGRHYVEDALPLDALSDSRAVGRVLISPLSALHHLHTIQVGVGEAAALSHGRTIPAPEQLPTGTIVAIAYEERLLAIAEIDDGRVQPRKVLADE